jgi:hypothetical protein
MIGLMWCLSERAWKYTSVKLSKGDDNVGMLQGRQPSNPLPTSSSSPSLGSVTSFEMASAFSSQSGNTDADASCALKSGAEDEV